MKKQTAIFFWVLSIYVVLQFLWWGYHLIELSTELVASEEYSNSRILMIIGEGSVFFLILLLGLWKIQSSIKKDIAISRRQSNFLLSVTHELKTPLASNKLYLQTVLKRKTLKEEEKEKLLNNALKENARLEGMIENILTATRIESHKLDLSLKELNLTQLIADITNEWANERTVVKLELAENISLKTDEFIIRTVLINLLDNALKYSGDKVEITVYLMAEDNQVTFGVKDNGVGVPTKFRKAVFEKFTRIGNEETRKQKGTGLGLYIVAQLLELINADIACLPNEPSGSNFKITLENEENRSDNS